MPAPNPASAEEQPRDAAKRAWMRVSTVLIILGLVIEILPYPIMYVMERVNPNFKIFWVMLIITMPLGAIMVVAGAATKVIGYSRMRQGVPRLASSGSGEEVLQSRLRPAGLWLVVMSLFIPFVQVPYLEDLAFVPFWLGIGLYVIGYVTDRRRLHNANQ